MKNNKGFVGLGLVLAIIALLAIGGGVYYVGTKNNSVPKSVENNLPVENQDSNINTPVQNNQVNNTTTQNTNTKSFKLGTLEFFYPNILTFKKEGETASLSHSISSKHVNYCDLKDGLSINDVADFSVSFRLFDKNLKDTVQINGSDYFSKNFFKNNTFVLSDGFIEKFNIGSLNGFKITMGVEGCGVYNYYFPISLTQTLFINRNWHVETYPPVDRPKLNKIPGFITSDQEESIFNNILSSIKGLEQQSTISVKVYFRKEPNVCFDQNIKVASFNRLIPKTQAVARASIEELLKGPTQEEKSNGYWSDIPDGTYIKSITITNGEALIDFNEKIESGITSCNGGGTRISQIRQTLLQFPTVKTVKLSVNGRTEDIFQP